MRCVVRPRRARGEGSRSALGFERGICEFVRNESRAAALRRVRVPVTQLQPRTSHMPSFSSPSSFLRPALGCALAFAAWAAPATAQCPTLDPSFVRPRGDEIQSFATFDDGGGTKLFAANQIGLSSWDGTRWTYGLEPGQVSSGLWIHDFGSGDELVLATGFPAQVKRWNGATWSDVGPSFDGRVHAFTTYDDGVSSRLVATGVFTQAGAQSVNAIAVFDGNAWSPLGSGLEAEPFFLAQGFALTTWTHGTSTDLVVGGDFSRAGGVPAANVARWDGNAWSALGAGTDAQVNSLAAFGAPGAQTLIAGGAFLQAGGLASPFAARFDGTAWSALGAGLSPGNGVTQGVDALLVVGADLFASGSFLVAGGSPLAENVARFDGAAWHTLGDGLELNSCFGIQALESFDPLDGGGARVFAAGGVGPGLALAQWNGAQWSSLRDDGALGLVFQPSNSGARSAAVWQGELVVAGEFETAGNAAGAAGVARFDGTTWRGFAPLPVFRSAEAATVVRALDLGAGAELLVGMLRYDANDVSIPLYRWTGAAWAPLAPGSQPTGTGFQVFDALVFDDGSGAKLYAAGSEFNVTPSAAPRLVWRFESGAWTAVGSFASVLGTNATVQRLAVHDDGGGPALYAAGRIEGGVQRWNGTAWSSVGNLVIGIGAGANDLAVHDDGSGPALFASGNFGTWPAVTTLQRWDGSAWTAVAVPAGFQAQQIEVHDDGSGNGARLYASNFGPSVYVRTGAAWSPVVFAGPSFTFASLFASPHLPRGGGVLLHGNLREAASPGGVLTPQGGLALVSDCPRVTTFCTGDGLDAALVAACPCANLGAAGHGCAWGTSANGVAGGRLETLGSPLDDTLVLVADSMPATGSSLFFQGTPNAAGAVFGDGLRCAAGTIVRLRTRTNQGGAAQVPAAGEPTLASMGGVVPGSGSVRAYQVWMRVAASFCTSAPFNTTNAVRVRW